MRKREIAPRWRKVLADLWGNKIRTLLVVASIAVGVFALGTVTGTYLIILQDMDAQYQSINPHSAYVYSAPFEDDLGGLGTALAVPISRVLGTAVGVSLMSTPLAVTFAWDGFVIWLVVVLVLSALASILPARNASRITIRDALAYE